MNKKIFILASSLIVLNSCTSISKKECSKANWGQKGYDEIKQQNPWQQNLKRYSKVCTKYGFTLDEAAYRHGVSTALSEKCTGYPEFQKDQWAGVGIRDALSGQKKSLNDYKSDCGPYGIEINIPEYKSGLDKGLDQFCTKDSGLNFGKTGSAYNMTCTKKDESSFLKGYHIGILVNKAAVTQKEYNTILKDIESLKGDVQRKNQNIKDLATDVGQLKADATSQDILKAKDMGQAIQELQNDITNLNSYISDFESKSKILMLKKIRAQNAAKKALGEF